MDEILLTVKEVAELKGCSERYIRTMITDKKLESVEMTGLSTGQGGTQYRVPLVSLEPKLQLKHKRIEKKKAKAACAKKVEDVEDVEPLNLEDLTAAEREEIVFWKGLMGEWQSYRNTACGVSKEDADGKFIACKNGEDKGLELTRRTLYRKWKDFKAMGEVALLDKRGKHDGHAKKLVSEIWDIFESFYLEQNQRTVQLCMTLTKLELAAIGRECLEIPTVDVFARAVKKIPIPYVKWFREGEKAYIGDCEPYIKRSYEDLEPNDIWVADNHTFDIMVHDGEKTLRVYLTAFMDVRTRKMMGWCVTDKPCADATIYALKKGIEKFGRPKMLLTDNGREFLFHDFGGNGFRRKRKKDEEFKPPTILKSLDIGFSTAKPRNARAKGIERAFGTVKENFSKLFEAYTGGNVLEKPDRLKVVVKDFDRMKKVDEFIGFVDTYLAGWYNKQPHSGEGMYGKSPDEAFEELLVEKRTITEDQLNLMFMRWSNPMAVGKNGVTLTFYGKELQYSDEYLWKNYFGKEKVYVRYNPDDLKEVRVYDSAEKFICTAKLKEELGYKASKDEIAKQSKLNNASTKGVKNYLKSKGIKTNKAAELMVKKAMENIAEGKEITGQILSPLWSAEEIPQNEFLQKAVGSDFEFEDAIDWTAALKNRRSELNGKNND